MGFFDDIYDSLAGAAEWVWDKVPEAASTTATAVSSPNSKDPKSSSAWTDTFIDALINTGISTVASTAAGVFQGKADDERSEKEIEQELEMMRLRDKYGFNANLGLPTEIARDRAKAEASKALAQGYKDSANQRLAVGDRKARSLGNLAELAQRAALRSAK